MPANRFPCDEQCRDRFAKLPNEFACGIGLTLIDLSADRMGGCDQDFAGRSSNGAGNLGCRRQRNQPQGGDVCGDDRNSSYERPGDAAQAFEKLCAGLSAPSECFLAVAINVATGAIDLHGMTPFDFSASSMRPARAKGFEPRLICP
jgi:hypothetical protein